MKIQPQDLRIGNWVYESKISQFPMQVVNIGTDYVYLDFEGNEGDVWEPNIKDIEPIPLTEELLLKLGFERIDSGHAEDHEDYHQWLEKVYPTIGCVYQGDGNNVFLEKFDDLKIYDLHQFQNIYFALMGEELNIEL